jgi:hypothetical protein
MPDGAIAVRKGKASFHQLAVDLIKEAELDSRCGIAPDSEVAATVSEGGAEGSRVCWKHWPILPVKCFVFIKKPTLFLIDYAK